MTKTRRVHLTVEIKAGTTGISWIDALKADHFMADDAPKIVEVALVSETGPEATRASIAQQLRDHAPHADTDEEAALWRTAADVVEGKA